MTLPDDDKAKQVPRWRILLWIGVAGVGIYYVVNGLIGASH